MVLKNLSLIKKITSYIYLVGNFGIIIYFLCYNLGEASYPIGMLILVTCILIMCIMYVLINHLIIKRWVPAYTIVSIESILFVTIVTLLSVDLSLNQ